jgi:hypothetical protein
MEGARWASRNIIISSCKHAKNSCSCYTQSCCCLCYKYYSSSGSYGYYIKCCFFSPNMSSRTQEQLRLSQLRQQQQVLQLQYQLQLLAALCIEQQLSRQQCSTYCGCWRKPVVKCQQLLQLIHVKIVILVLLLDCIFIYPTYRNWFYMIVNCVPVRVEPVPG